MGSVHHTIGDGMTAVAGPEATAPLTAALRRRRRSRRVAGRRLVVTTAQIAASFLGAAILWDALRALGVLPTEYFPEITAIVRRLVTELGAGPSGAMLHATGETLVTWCLGFALAGVIGIGLGVLVGNSAYAAALLAPLMRFVRSTPAVAFIPAAILVAGVGVTAKLLIVVFAGVWPVLLNTAGATSHVIPQYRDTATAVGLGKRELITRVIVPTVSPAIVTGLRVSMSLTLAVTIGVDLLIGSAGLGALIARYQAVGQLTSAYAGILWAGLLGAALNVVLIAIERRLLFWSPEYRSKAS